MVPEGEGTFQVDMFRDEGRGVVGAGGDFAMQLILSWTTSYVSYGMGDLGQHHHHGEQGFQGEHGGEEVICETLSGWAYFLNGSHSGFLKLTKYQPRIRV